MTIIEPTPWAVVAFWLIYVAVKLLPTALAARPVPIRLVTVAARLAWVAASMLPTSAALVAMAWLFPRAERLFGVLGATGSVLCVVGWVVQRLLRERVMRLLLFTQEPAHDDTGG